MSKRVSNETPSTPAPMTDEQKRLWEHQRDGLYRDVERCQGNLTSIRREIVGLEDSAAYVLEYIQTKKRKIYEIEKKVGVRDVRKN